jgi:drug/metabolite transporter (DMT)-like permease
VYLMLPGLTAPPWLGALLMAVAGVSWGVYSLRGRGVRHPLAQTTTNFVRAVPLVLLGSIIAWRQFHIEPIGVALAVASGALASGVGYVIWYAALRGLTATRAAVVQLAVPVLAAAGGVVFLQETISARLVVSTVMVLGGIGLAIAGRDRFTPAGAASSEVTAEASGTTSI